MRSWSFSLAVGVLALASWSCGGAQHKTAAQQNHEEGRSKGFSVDDKSKCTYQGRADREVSETTAVGALQPNILICREVDTNLDGIKDVMRTFNDKGEPMREEADTDYDGNVDSWIIFSNGRVAKQELDTNHDGKPDVWKFYLDGKLSRVQRDTNHDGKPDVWEIYGKGHLERIGVDVDFDGRVDRWDRDEAARLADEAKEADAGAPEGGS
jgi:hypothetical protein